MPKKADGRLTPEQFEHLIRECPTGMHRSLVWLHAAGLRGREVMNLELADVDFGTAEIRAGRNGNLRQRVAMNAAMLQDLSNYIRHGRPRVADNAVIIHAAGRRFTCWKAMRDRLREAARAAGLPEDLCLGPCLKGLHKTDFEQWAATREAVSQARENAEGWT